MLKMRYAAVLLAAFTLLPAAPAEAQWDLFAKMFPRSEVPALSTFALAEFSATMDEERSTIEYELSYEKTDGNVTQSHIHFGQAGVNGGIMIFLCSNLGNGPAGTQACPPAPATITGTITAENVGAGALAQGVNAGNIFEVTRGILQGVTYVNVHTDLFPGGEIRGQVVATAIGSASAPSAEE